MTEAPQYIRDNVADFICPIDSIANYQQGYPRHEAEGIRAGRGDDHELVRLVMGCVVPVVDEGVIQADRDAAADHGLAIRDMSPEFADEVRSGGHDDGPDVQAFRRHRQQHAPPSPSGYERGLEDAAKVIEALKWCISPSLLSRIEVLNAIRNLKDPAR